MKLNRLYLLATIIFVLAVLLRFLYIDTIPNNLTMDEVNNGYTAYSLLKTGHDEWGNFLPFSFRSVGDYKPPILIYLTVPSIALFGLNEFSVRFPVALASLFSLLFTFLLSKKFLFAKQPLWFHLFVLFLFATSPWTSYSPDPDTKPLSPSSSFLLTFSFFYSLLRKKDLFCLL